MTKSKVMVPRWGCLRAIHLPPSDARWRLEPLPLSLVIAASTTVPPSHEVEKKKKKKKGLADLLYFLILLTIDKKKYN